MFDRGNEPLFVQQMLHKQNLWPDSDFSKSFDGIVNEQHAIINSFYTQTRRDRGTQTDDGVDQTTQTGELGDPKLPLSQRTGLVGEIVYKPRI